MLPQIHPQSTKSQIKLLVFLILVFSLTLKTWKLTTNPSALFTDELLSATEGYSILTTLKDSHGEFLPIFFRGFDNDNISPYQIYLSIPALLLFGKTDFAIRITPVIISIFETLLFYMLLKRLMNLKAALVGTLIFTISPWHYHISRLNMGLFNSWTLFTLLAVLFFTKAYQQKSLLSYSLASAFLGLASYAYIPARLITPLVFLLLTLLLIVKKYYKETLFFSLIYLVVLIPFIGYHTTNPNSFKRFSDTTGIKNLSVVDEYRKKLVISLAKWQLGEEIFLSVPTENPIENPLKTFFTKYLTHFDSVFLFEKGEIDYPGGSTRRHSIANLGLLFPQQKILIILGLCSIIFTIIKNRKLELLPIIFLLILFPVSDSLVKEGAPFATRSYLGVLPLNILAAYGFYTLLRLTYKTKKINFQILNVIITSSIMFSVISSVFILIIRFTYNPLTTSDFWGWQYGAKEIISYFKIHQYEYHQLIMEPEFNGPEIFLKFYGPDCYRCKVGNFASYNPKLKQLFALSPHSYETIKKKNPTVTLRVKNTITSPNNSAAFIIVETGPKKIAFASQK